MFPISRLRRLRRNPQLRSPVNETTLDIKTIIYLIFVEEKIHEKVEIQALPDLYRIPEQLLAKHVQDLYDEGISNIMLFGVSKHKDKNGTDNLKENGLLSRIIRIAKQAVPRMTVISDHCFCEYTTHGHCGILHHGHLDNDATLNSLSQQAVISAKAGADIVAPFAMMDGQVQAIRTALDKNGFQNIPIMTYSSKFASSFYDPFREAAGSSLKGDRKTYQMNYANRHEALRESRTDEMEGTDIFLIKPAGILLDIISDIAMQSSLPIAAYQVSGEYAAVKFVAKAGAT